MADRRTEIIRIVHELTQNLGKFPRVEDLPFARDTVRYWFGSMAALRDAYDEWVRSEGESQGDELLAALNPQKCKKERAASKKVQQWEDTWGATHQEIEHTAIEVPRSSRRRYIVGSVVVGSHTTDRIVQTVRRAASKMDADIILIPCAHPVAKVSPNGKGFIDRRFGDLPVVSEAVYLNENLQISGIRLQAQQQDPASGMMALGKRGGSMIAGHPQQRLQLGATLGDAPHAFYTPGALTLPDYATDRYSSKRLAYLAEERHSVGAMIVEIEDEEIFYARHVQLDDEAEFVDIGTKYGPVSDQPWRAKYVVPGDLHAGETCEDGLKALERLCSEIHTPDSIICHDLFDCAFSNHHERKNVIKRAERPNRSMEVELGIARDLMFRLRQHCKEGLVIARGNHDDALDRYLEDGAFLREPENFWASVALLEQRRLHGQRLALRDGINFVGGAPSGTQWLKAGERFEYEGIELGQHGHQGPNGARGTPKNTELSLGPAVIGHIHGPFVHRGVYGAGCMVPTEVFERMGYAQGQPSNWMRAIVPVYPGGYRQNHLIINGRYRLQ